VLGVGLLLAGLWAQCLAAINVCFADSACYPSSSGLKFREFFGLLVVGIVVSVAGAVQMIVGLRTEPRTVTWWPVPR